MMNVLICDDMRSETKELADLLSDSGFDVNTVIFHSGEEVLAYYLSGAVADVCFLDIVMPEMSGIVLAEKLRKNGYTGKIVFLTNSNDYAAESYMVDAFFYLLKPLTPGKVWNILFKLEEVRKNADTGGILVKTGGTARFILFRDVSHVEVIRHSVHFRLTGGDEIGVNATLGEIAPQLLSDSRFIQCHRSFIVNMSDISTISGREITMRSGKNLPISKSYPETKKNYLQWIFREGYN